MSTHTPGPWLRFHKYTIAVDGVGAIATVHQINFDMAEANARLIAAAPRMYDRISKLAADGDAESIAIMETINGNA